MSYVLSIHLSIHLNINSLIPKIDELRLIAKNSNPAIIGISESKLDKSILDNEIKIDGYELKRSDRNRQSGGVACYIRKDLSFNVREDFSPDLENIFLTYSCQNPNQSSLASFTGHLTQVVSLENSI